MKRVRGSVRLYLANVGYEIGVQRPATAHTTGIGAGVTSGYAATVTPSGVQYRRHSRHYSLRRLS